MLHSGHEKGINLSLVELYTPVADKTIAFLP